MSSSPENEPVAYLTVGQAAEHLSVTLPRLRRLLAQESWQTKCKSVSRKTRTGTRTALVIPIHLLPQIRDDLKGSSTASQRLKKPISNETASTSSSQEAVELLQKLVLELQQRTAEQASVIADLRLERDRAIQERERLQMEMEKLLMEREKTRRSRSSSGNSSSEADQETGKSTKSRRKTQPVSADPPEQKPWWQVWRR